MADSRLEELRAEDYAYSKLGRDYLSMNSIKLTAQAMQGLYHKPAAIMGSITRALEKLGYEPLDREERSELWAFLKEGVN